MHFLPFSKASALAFSYITTLIICLVFWTEKANCKVKMKFMVWRFYDCQPLLSKTVVDSLWQLSRSISGSCSNAEKILKNWQFSDGSQHSLKWRRHLKYITIRTFWDHLQFCSNLLYISWFFIYRRLEIAIFASYRLAVWHKLDMFQYLHH